LENLEKKKKLYILRPGIHKQWGNVSTASRIIFQTFLEHNKNFAKSLPKSPFDFRLLKLSPLLFFWGIWKQNNSAGGAVFVVYLDLGSRRLQII